MDCANTLTGISVLETGPHEYRFRLAKTILSRHKKVLAAGGYCEMGETWIAFKTAGHAPGGFYQFDADFVRKYLPGFQSRSITKIST